MTGRQAPLQDRLQEKLVSNAEGCREWQGYRNANGYGSIYSGSGKNVLAHRAAWELANGPVPVGLRVLHRCDNPRCCNVEHLFLGTQQDNVQDMYQKGRANHASGHTAGGSKLTPQQVRSIRERYVGRGVTPTGNQASAKSLAAEFSINPSAVHRIVNYTTYKEST